ncbi:hypothetical protein [Pseudoruegeria aquimaris]|uniref:hypothetical protein n=1 Tax=Pseudoruegeria aquimaris TaxID=393663 RepID=UPI00111C5EC9|nr:hypothetical protein [Pseudoruegeria aquimaris]
MPGAALCTVKNPAFSAAQRFVNFFTFFWRNRQNALQENKSFSDDCPILYLFRIGGDAAAFAASSQQFQGGSFS